jgi:predicted phosphodiesterase
LSLSQGSENVRIAVLADIHGNLPALEAVMADVKSQAPDEIWCGGDLAWGGPWASECIAAVRDAGWPTVKGNTDVWITGDPQTISSETERQELAELARDHSISEEDAGWLVNLPIGYSGSGSILLVHASPESPFSAPGPEAPAAEFSIYEGHAALVVYGHVHEAFTRRLSEGTIVANTGSVGLPKDGSTSSYLVIDQHGPDLLMRHRRVRFDIERATAEARKKGGMIAARFVETMQELK